MNPLNYSDEKDFCFTVFLGNIVVGLAQNQMQQNAITSFTINYNNNDFEKIYASFSAKMKKARTKKQYFDFFSRVKNERGSLRSTELTNYQESKLKSKAQYIANFEFGSGIIRISMNAQNEIIGFYIVKENLM
ncbi:MAG: DUF3887 domain-containing protein [Flavobacterium sp.]|nr:DUF3887 domain-containing protein [Flavobacterium sp.]